MRQFFLQLAMHQTLQSQLELSHVTCHFATYKMLCCKLQQSCELQESRTILFCNIARQVASCTCSTPLQLAMFFSCNHCVARKLLHITCIGFRNCSHLTVIVKGGAEIGNAFEVKFHVPLIFLYSLCTEHSTSYKCSKDDPRSRRKWKILTRG